MNKNDSFSVRMGYETPQALQVNDLDEDALNAIRNVLNPIMNGITQSYKTNNIYRLFLKTIGGKFFNLRHDEPIVDEITIRLCSTTIYKKDFYYLFKFIEFVYQNAMLNIPVEWEDIKPDWQEQFNKTFNKFPEKLNDALRRTNVGYTFLNGKFIPITSTEELAELKIASTTPYENANTHIKKATGFFSNRENPDYENSMKESICAVESLVKELVGDDKATLSDGIKKLKENGINIHPAFKEALNKLYGFTSDAKGIRHGGSGDSIQADQATARFMLITCSAFVNYIIANAPSDN